MKFASEVDAQLFLIEVGENPALCESLKTFTPTNEQLDSFISKRTRMESIIKDHRKSQVAKGAWRKNRYSMMKGIKAFHRSTEGKRFHRNLGNFLATRLTLSDSGRTATQKTNEDFEFLKSLNSAKTHLYIELEYYHQIYEQVELEEFALDYAYTLFRSIESKVVKGQKLNENEELFLLDITESAALISSFAKKAGKDVTEVENMWNSIKASLIKDGKSEKDADFYKLLVGSLKNSLNLT